jgi:hypothetical protein
VACFLLLLALPFILALSAGRGGMLWLALGGGIWAVSVGIKFVATDLLELAGVRRFQPAWRALVHGLVSALCELGAAAVAFVWLLPPNTALHAAAFGAGAGWTEMLAILILGLRTAGRGSASAPDPASKAGSDLPQHVQWTFVVERGLTLIGHLGSRGLVWLLARGFVWCGVLALATFTLVDGLASYGKFRKWDWLAISCWKRFYGFLAVIGALEVGVFAIVSGFVEQ